MRSSRALLYFGSILLLAGCGAQSIKPSDKHIADSDAGTVQNKDIPPTVRNSVLLPPKPAPRVETYSVVVTNVPAQEVLFALARDAKINLDIYPGLQGYITLNAVNQTLPQILDRISRQIDIRYEWNGPNLSVMPDTPYLKQYKIDYVNMDRDANSTINAGAITGSATAGSTAAPAGGAPGANSSQLSIRNSSKNHFWETLVQNVKDILHETDKILPAGSSETVVQQSKDINTSGTGLPGAVSAKKGSKPAGIENSPNPANLQEGATTVTRTSTFREAASVIANPETGVITVRATGKQHEKIQQFIDQVMSNARRQVLIEVTVAEVSLNSNYQQGIDWSKLLSAGATKGFQLTQAGTPGLPATNTGSMFLLNYINPTSKFGALNANISLLESFGNVKVLSSPKLSVMNNQTAVLRVVDNLVYFSMTVTPGTVNTLTGTMSTPPTYTSNLQTSPVGFTMSLTPQINDSDSVLLNIHPSITRLLGYVKDPNPSLANPCLGIGTCPGVINNIPQTSTREMESVLKIENNQIAVLGGLMQDEADKLTDGIPLLADIPIVGNLFKNRNDTTKKTELVIFLRPVVITEPSVNGSFSEFRSSLPDANFFNSSKKQMSQP